MKVNINQIKEISEHMAKLKETASVAQLIRKFLWIFDVAMCYSL